MSDQKSLEIFCLRQADTALILGHRLSEWCGHAPTMEEDMALANIALDLIGQARVLYNYAGTLGGEGKSEDDLAYLRDAPEYRNLLIAELPNGDFAFTILRLFLMSAYSRHWWDRMSGSKDETLSGLAEKSTKEVAYHYRHSAEWVIRLGDGTQESALRLAAALDDLWRYTGEMFQSDEAEDVLCAHGLIVEPGAVNDLWLKDVSDVFSQAMMSVPHACFMQTGGRIGRHTEHLGYLLAEMQFLQRAYPGASW